MSPAARDQFKLDYMYGVPRAKGLAVRPDEINAGSNSGFQAIGLAHVWGATRVLLLGFDMQRSGGRVHWHADHPKKLGNGGRFDQWCIEMGFLAKDAQTRGLEIINCSRKTALTCFKRSTIEDCI